MTAATSANNISIDRQIIKDSIEAAKKQAITHTKNILHWLKPIKEGAKQVTVVNDVYSKKKKRKDTSVGPRLIHPSLLGYITLQQDEH